MSRDVTPLYIADVSSFAKTLHKSIAAQTTPPGHARMLALVAQAAGYANHQHLKAETPKAAVQSDGVTRALRVFDPSGRMTRWPGKTRIQGLCLWPIWSHLPPGRDITEPEVNDIIRAGLAFEDHVLIRRSLIDHKLAERAKDGSFYRRIEQRPPSEALDLMRLLR